MSRCQTWLLYEIICIILVQYEVSMPCSLAVLTIEYLKQVFRTMKCGNMEKSMCYRSNEINDISGFSGFLSQWPSVFTLLGLI